MAQVWYKRVSNRDGRGEEGVPHPAPHCREGHYKCSQYSHSGGGGCQCYVTSVLTSAPPCIGYYKQNKLNRLVYDDSRQLEWGGGGSSLRLAPPRKND